VVNGIVDAFIHTTEQYCSNYDQGRLQDRQAEGILRTLIEVAMLNIKENVQYKDRADFMWSATQALNGLISCGVTSCWSAHMIGHELTVFFLFFFFLFSFIFYLVFPIIISQSTKRHFTDWIMDKLLQSLNQQCGRRFFLSEPKSLLNMEDVSLI